MKLTASIWMLICLSNLALGQCDPSFSDTAKTKEIKDKMACLVAENQKLKRAAAIPENGRWEHELFEGMTGATLATWLTEKGRNPADVIVSVDGSHNAFHVWWRGVDAGRRYTYRIGSPEDLKSGSQVPYFFSGSKTVFIGIGGVGNLAVPIYFDVY